MDFLDALRFNAAMCDEMENRPPEDAEGGAGDGPGPDDPDAHPPF